MKRFNEFVNEGLRDAMKPVSKEDVEKKMDSMDVGGKLKAFKDYGVEHNLTDKEIEVYFTSLIHEGEYLILKPSEKGLTIELTEEGKEEIDEISSDHDFYDFFEDIQGNSDYEYHSDLGSSGFGMTDAPGITYGYYYDDDGDCVDDDSSYSEIYLYGNYVIKSFLDELKEKGEVFFISAT